MNILTRVGLLLCIFLQFQHTSAQYTRVIPEISLISGRADSVYLPDLFPMSSAELRIEPNPAVAIHYNAENKFLVFQPRSDFKGLTLAKLQSAEGSVSLLLRSRILPSYRFQFFAPSAKNVSVMGVFNDWNRTNLPMNSRGNGSFEKSVSLEAGQYEYKFVVDGKEMPDPKNPVKVPNGMGDFNSILSVPDNAEGRAFLHIADQSSTVSGTMFNFFVEINGRETDVAPENIVVLLDNESIINRKIPISGSTFGIPLAVVEMRGRQTLRVAVSFADGITSNIQTILLENGRVVGSQNSSFRWHDAVLYSLMIDRFSDGNRTNSAPVRHDSVQVPANYQGGDFAGITQKLREGYFDSLGINTLWLSPVNKNTDSAFPESPEPHRWYTGYHGYWGTHHEETEERFGSMDELQMLVNEAHRRNIKVLLDLSAHHVHQEHPLFREHPDWFGTLNLPDGRKNIRLWDEYRLTTWFEPFLPSFDYERSKEAREFMTDNAIWWLRQTRADGFRHDAAKHVPNVFWRLLTEKLRKEVEIPNNDVYQVGETFGSYDLIKSYINNGQMDGQFNFNLFHTARQIFLTPSADFATLDAELHKTFAVFGVNNLTANIMDSHDKERYMAFADGDLSFTGSNPNEIAWTNPPQVDNPKSYDKAKLYLAYVLTIPGLPTIYYGDEIGMTGAGDPDNRRMMRFGNKLSSVERKMLKETRAIIRLRTQFPALRYGDFLTLKANQDIFAYCRSDFNQRVIVVLNKAEKEVGFSLELPRQYKGETLRDALTGEKISVQSARKELRLAPTAFRIFVLE